MQQGFIKYFVIIIVILAVAFLSQQAYCRKVGQNLISAAANQAGAYLSKGANWAISNIYPKLSGEVKSGGEMIKTEANQIKNIPENILDKTKNYFSGIGNSVLHPKENNSCLPAQTVQNSTSK